MYNGRNYYTNRTTVLYPTLYTTSHYKIRIGWPTGGIITEKYINISLVLMNISKCLAYFNLK